MLSAKLAMSLIPVFTLTIADLYLHESSHLSHKKHKPTRHVCVWVDIPDPTHALSHTTRLSLDACLIFSLITTHTNLQLLQSSCSVVLIIFSSLSVCEIKILHMYVVSWWDVFMWWRLLNVHTVVACDCVVQTSVVLIQVKFWRVKDVALALQICLAFSWHTPIVISLQQCSKIFQFHNILHESGLNK